MVTMDTISVEEPCNAVDPAHTVPVFSLRGVRERLQLWWRRRKTRVRLSELSEQQLQDVGLSVEMAEREIRKSRLLLLDRPYQPPC